MSNRSRNLGRLVKAMHTAEQSLSGRINRELASIGLNRSQLSVLASCSSQPNRSQSVSSLVALSSLNQPAVTKVVGYLIEQGWLQSEADSTDARKRALKITPEGLGVVVSAYGSLTPVIDEAFDGLSDESIRQLQQLLESFNNR